MRIFAIDPGNVYSAYCVMNDVYHLIEFAKLQNNEIMQAMKNNLSNSNEQTIVVIERVASYGMPVGKEVFETCEWIGRYSQEAEKLAPVHYMYRQEEKLWICHDSRAKDSNIRAALIERFAQHDFKNGKGTKKNPDVFYGVTADIWAAIAIAVTKIDMLKERKPC